MSRCFPFPPPNYAKPINPNPTVDSNRPVVSNLAVNSTPLIKESVEERHRREKKEKKEKRREKKEKKQKKKEKKEKEREKEKKKSLIEKISEKKPSSSSSGILGPAPKSRVKPESDDWFNDYFGSTQTKVEGNKGSSRIQEQVTKNSSTDPNEKYSLGNRTFKIIARGSENGVVHNVSNKVDEKKEIRKPLINKDHDKSEEKKKDDLMKVKQRNNGSIQISSSNENLAKRKYPETNDHAGQFANKFPKLALENGASSDTVQNHRKVSVPDRKFTANNNGQVHSNIVVPKLVGPEMKVNNGSKKVKVHNVGPEMNNGNFLLPKPVEVTESRSRNVGPKVNNGNFLVPKPMEVITESRSRNVGPEMNNGNYLVPKPVKEITESRTRNVGPEVKLNNGSKKVKEHNVGPKVNNGNFLLPKPVEVVTESHSRNVGPEVNNGNFLVPKPVGKITESHSRNVGPEINNGNFLVPKPVGEITESHTRNVGPEMNNGNSLVTKPVEVITESSSRKVGPEVKSKKVKEHKPPRPHRDLKYLNKILTVPVMECCEAEDEEWLFSKKDSKKLESYCNLIEEESKTVWDKAVKIESVDVIALPYVIPY